MEYLFALIQFLIVAPMFLFPGCDCCGGFDCGECTEGEGGSLASQTWRVVVSGVTDDIGSDCDLYNGTHDLVLGSGFPACQSACVSLASDKSIGLTIFISEDADEEIDGFDLDFDTNTDCTSSGVTARYNKATNPSACTGASFVLAGGLFDPPPGPCGDWPTSLTITAV
jgi:hypothetical protein